MGILKNSCYDINAERVQIRLTPILAQTFALHFAGRSMSRQYEQNKTNMKGGDFSFLADLHATSSGLKSLSTVSWLASI